MYFLLVLHGCLNNDPKYFPTQHLCVHTSYLLHANWHTTWILSVFPPSLHFGFPGRKRGRMVMAHVGGIYGMLCRAQVSCSCAAHNNIHSLAFFWHPQHTSSRCTCELVARFIGTASVLEHWHLLELKCCFRPRSCKLFHILIFFLYFSVSHIMTMFLLY